MSETWRGEIYVDGRLLAQRDETGTALECQDALEHWWNETHSQSNGPYVESHLRMTRIAVQPIGPQALVWRQPPSKSSERHENPSVGSCQAPGRKALAGPRSVPWELRYR